MIETLLIIVGSIVTGWKLREITAIITYRKMQQEEQKQSRIEELAEKIEQSFIEASVRKIGDIFYVHNKKTGEFLAQGKDSIEISNALRSRFPKKRFVMDKNDLIMIGLYDE